MQPIKNGQNGPNGVRILLRYNGHLISVHLWNRLSTFIPKHFLQNLKNPLVAKLTIYGRTLGRPVDMGRIWRPGDRISATLPSPMSVPVWLDKGQTASHPSRHNPAPFGEMTRITYNTLFMHLFMHYSCTFWYWNIMFTFSKWPLSIPFELPMAMLRQR